VTLRKQSDHQLSFDFDGPSVRKMPIKDLLTTEDIFAFCDEAFLRNFGKENSLVEKKPSGIHGKDLGQYISMWANTIGGGIIAVGIRNDNIFEGCSRLSTNQKNLLEKAPGDFCPDANVKLKKIPIKRDEDQQDDFILLYLVEYHHTKVVATTNGKVFRRVGDSKKEIRADVLRNLRAEKGEVRVEIEPCGLTYPQEFDTKAIDEFVETVRNAKSWDESHSREEILSLMHLGILLNGQFLPNTALALLFAKDPRLVIPGCRIRFIKFPGETEGAGTSWITVKDEYLEGTIPSIIEQTARMLKSQLRTFSRLGKDGQFYTSPEYPEFSWYEAIVNACAHRSYGNGLRNTNIFVKMFDDRLVVESPGGFPPEVNPKNIYDTHLPRNPFLMDAMFYLKFVRCAHEGTRRIRSEMLSMDLPEPEFMQDEVGNVLVRVTLRNKIKQRKVWVDADVIEILGAQLAQELSEQEKRFINFCAEYGEISVSDAQRLTGMTWPAASKTLMGLVTRGILVHKHKQGVDRDPRARFKLREIRKL